MKTRAEAVVYIRKQLEEPELGEELFKRKHEKHHYGTIELRDLMDFIYEGLPVSEDEHVPCGWISN